MNIAAPEIVLGAALLSFFVLINFHQGLQSIFIAHVMFNIAFVAIVVRARLAGFHREIEEAAQDLYANAWQTFLKVTLPLIWPGILAGGLLAFALSIDDFVTTNFVAGQTVTFPLWVYGAVKVGIPPQVFVMGTAIFLAGLVVAVINVFSSRRAEQGGTASDQVRWEPTDPSQRQDFVCVRARPSLGGERCPDPRYVRPAWWLHPLRWSSCSQGCSRRRPRRHAHPACGWSRAVRRPRCTAARRVGCSWIWASTSRRSEGRSAWTRGARRTRDPIQTAQVISMSDGSTMSVPLAAGLNDGWLGLRRLPSDHGHR